MSKNGVRNNKMYGWIKRINSVERSKLKKSQETKDKISKSLQGRKTSTGMLGNNHKKESKTRISKSQIGRMKDSPRSIYAWFNSPENEFILFGPLLHECKIYKLNNNYIKELIDTDKKFYKGWSFYRYATLDEKETKIKTLKEQGLMI
jgi:hypothetical protein